jgi:hypothetical protein
MSHLGRNKMRFARLGRAVRHLGTARRLYAPLIAAAVVAGGLTVGTASPAAALGAGRVCLFNAPSGAEIGGSFLGHTGWAFRVGTADDWIFGATENYDWNWSDEGSWNHALSTFKVAHNPGYYTRYRCKNTPNSAVGAAINTYIAGFNRDYNGLEDNCLSRSVEVFKAYDSSLSGLGDGKSTPPNSYYNLLGLSGFEGSVTL